MATEKLIVELDARTAKLDAKLQKTQEELDGLKAKTDQNDFALFKLSETAKKTVGVMTKFATAAIAVNAAISAMVLSASSNRKELELLSTQAKTSTSNFQALAFATEKYGINAEKIADISKDISDKVGEFSAAGTGAFQDYADVMKLTKDEAQKLATSFQDMSSEEVIGTMMSEMEKAGVAGDRMTFVLESMGSDLSRLKPLFAGNSQELKKLKDRFKSVNDELQITDHQADQLKEVSTSYKLMSSQAGNAATAISATLAPVMDDFFNDVIDVVPAATQTVIDFINSFLEAEHITTQSAVLKEITESQARIVGFEEEIASFKAAQNSYSKDGGAFNVSAIIQLEEAIEKEKERTAELNDQLIVLQQIEDAKTNEGGEIGGETGEPTNPEQSGTGTGDQIKAISDRFSSEEELLIQKYERELEIIGENNELKMELEAEFLDNMIELDNRANEAKKKNAEKSAKDKLSLDSKRQKMEQDNERKNIGSIMTIISSLVGHNSSVGKALFISNQAVAASEVFFSTQAAAARALAELGPIAGPPAAASIETSGYLRMGAIAAQTLGSLSGGGGGGGSVSVGGGGGQEQAQQQDFQQETSSLELSEQDEGGTGVLRVEFATDSGDSLLDALAEGLNDRQRQGR